MSVPSFPSELRPTLRRASLQVALATLLCAAAVSLEHAASRARDRTAAEVARMQEALASNDRAHAARLAYAARYAQLRAQGRIGEAPPLAAVETLRAIAEEMGLRHLSFELQPASVTGGVEIRPMTLQVGLLHEGELLRFFDQLGARAPTGLWVRRCTLQRNGQGKRSWQRDSDNLVAECLLEWLTVKMP